MRIVGARPHPRILVTGFDEATIGALADIAPTVRPINSLHEVEQTEWDVLVARGGNNGAADHIFTIVVDAADSGVATVFGNVATVEQGFSVVLQRMGTTRANEFMLRDEAPERVARLLTDSVLPRLQERNENAILEPWVQAAPAAGARPTCRLTRWVTDSAERLIACSFRRSGNRADGWCLPSVVTDIGPWVAAALDIWSEQDATRFPPRVEWSTQAQWQTQGEALAVQRLENLARRRERVSASLDRRQDALQTALDAERLTAKQGARLLLTAQGNALVDAVQSTLGFLGFRVDDMDAAFPENDRREDLRIHDPGLDNWTAIAEVRGYHGGGQVNDLLRIGRFIRRYAQDENREPDAAWYIVNQFLLHPPEERPILLASNEGELVTFAEDRGLAIDTRDLFRLRRDVEGGAITAGDARTRLTSTLGRFTYP